MAPVRSLLLALALGGCSREPDVPTKTLTGSSAAVSGFPRHRARDRVPIWSCCTFQLGPGTRSELLQGTDSVVHDLSGPGYVLRIVFGPYTSVQPEPGYRLAGKRIVDGLEVISLEWIDRNRKSPEGERLWLAQVGGGTIDGVSHTPWGLRIMGDCGTPAACRGAAELVDTIRF